MLEYINLYNSTLPIYDENKERLLIKYDSILKDMDKTLIKDFFNKLAPDWGDGKDINNDIINIILDNAQVSEGKDILDVACGTGFLINYYLKRNVRFVTGVDLSDKMCEIASKRFNPEKVEIICADIEEF